MRRLFPQIRPFLSVFLLVVGLVAVVSTWRIPADIDFVQQRAALKITNFHAREYAARGTPIPLVLTRVSAAEYTAVLPATYHSPMALEYQVDALPATLKRRLLAVYVGNARIMDARDDGKTSAFGVIIPATVALNEGTIVRITTIPDDTAIAPPLGLTTLALTNITAYRWSMADSSVHFPGMGSGWWQVRARVMPRHPDNQPFDAHLYLGTTNLGAIPAFGGEFRSYRYLATPAASRGGDIDVRFVSEVWGNNDADARTLGVAVSDVVLDPLTLQNALDTFPVRFLTIPLMVLVFAIVAALGGVSPVLVGLITGVGLTVPLLYERFYLGMWYPHVLLLVVVSVGTIPLWRWLLARYGGATPWSTQTKTVLIGLILATIWVKGGGILYPIMRPIDIGWHMDKVREIAATWDFAKFYAPGAFSESVMPVTEWGENRPMIPYSPFYHFASLLFIGLPWSLEVSAMIFNTFLDASRIVLLAIIVRRSGATQRTAVLAGLLYAVTPVTFLLHAWGNAPTTTGFWWMLLATVAMLVAGRQLGDRRLFVVVTVISLAAMLSYTVAAVFHVVFVTVLALLLWLVPHRGEKPLPWQVLAVTYGGLLIATVLYYGLYIPPIIERTIPYFMQIGTQSTESVGVVRAPFGEYFAGFFPALRYDFVENPYLYYGLFIPIAVVIPAFLMLWKRRTLWIFAAAWFTVAVVFMFAGYKISMVDKQLFYIVPLLALCWAVYADRLWLRGGAGRVIVTTTVLFTLVSALQLWIIRIDRAPILLP